MQNGDEILTGGYPKRLLFWAPWSRCGEAEGVSVRFEGDLGAFVIDADALRELLKAHEAAREAEALMLEERSRRS